MWIWLFLENGGVIHKKVGLSIENQGEEKRSRVIGRWGDHSEIIAPKKCLTKL
jgi:hypothetical protein